MDIFGIGSRIKNLFGVSPKRGDESDSEDECDIGEVTVHRYTDQPNFAYDQLKVWKKHKKVEPLPLDTPVHPDRVRFVCISDTHERLKDMQQQIPPGDVLLHAGDFTMVGTVKAVQDFNESLGTLPHKHKIVIAGNHDLTFDEVMLNDPKQEKKFRLFWRLDPKGIREELKKLGVKGAQDLMTNCTYLQDAAVTLYGIKIYGSPWQPAFGNWAFNLPRGQPCLDKWNLIPDDTDVLITHGPPLGHGDLCINRARAGCVELLRSVQKRVKPKFHIFGHIHEDYGITTDGVTAYINASTLNLLYRPSHPPIIFDIPLPEGITKTDYSSQGKQAEQEITKTPHSSQEAEERITKTPHSSQEAEQRITKTPHSSREAEQRITKTPHSSQEAEQPITAPEEEETA